ncbi:hypothetical protein OC835_002874, partial [Tilletia horrida]
INVQYHVRRLADWPAARSLVVLASWVLFCSAPPPGPFLPASCGDASHAVGPVTSGRWRVRGSRRIDLYS